MTRKIYTRLMATLILVFAVTSCSDDLYIQGDKTAGVDEAFWSQYDFVLAEDDDATTRVAYESDKTSVFEEGDEIGVYAVDDDGNLVDEEPNSNVRYEVRSVTNLTTNETRQVLIPVDPNERVKRDCPHYVLYYPYNPNMTLTRLKSYTHTVAQDQGAEGAYEASDLLWAYYTLDGSDLYTIAFDHAMAQIVIELGGIYVPTDNRESAVKLLNMPTQATDINLVRPLDEKFTYNPVFSSGTEDEDRMITTWLFEAGSTEDRLQYRACVPAHTIAEGSPVVRVDYDATNYREYKIPSGLDLKPGYKYTFTLSKDGITDIEINDDDSWVLDVFDPETGDPVGLLCREYLRYQPDNTGITDPDEKTGTQATNGEVNINSQAWVFYNLQPGTTIPDLNTGTVLRFIYDIHLWSNTTGFTAQDAAPNWPLPHHKTGTTNQGLFTPEHGFKWVKYPGEDYGISANQVENQDLLNVDDKKETIFGLHGGKITWDGKNNKIIHFEKDESLSKLDYATAKANAHIAIDEDGNVSVSYSGLGSDSKHDVDGHKIGVIFPHYLVDQRNNSEGKLEVQEYPLVKIGYNQFWTSKPFRAMTMTDGTPLQCYNKKDAAGVTFGDEGIIGAGYIYPYGTFTNRNGQQQTYDPYNNPTEMKGDIKTPDGRGSTYTPAPLYNKVAVHDDRFVPKSTDGNVYYIMPTADEVTALADYYGILFAAKMCTREIVEQNGAEWSPAYDEYTAIARGETYEVGANFFTANISGFNLRAIGYFQPNTGLMNGIGSNACIILDSKEEQQGVDYWNFAVHNAWKSDLQVSSDNAGNDDKAVLQKNAYTYGDAYPSRFFAQVRLMMKYRNQADNGGSTNSLSSSRAATRAGGKSQHSRNVRVQLVE